MDFDIRLEMAFGNKCGMRLTEEDVVLLMHRLRKCEGKKRVDATGLSSPVAIGCADGSTK